MPTIARKKLNRDLKGADDKHERRVIHRQTRERRVDALSPDQRLRRAERAYNRIWAVHRPFFGADGKPAPYVMFDAPISQVAAIGALVPNGPRVTFIKDSLTDRLARLGGKGWAHGPRGTARANEQRAVEYILDHEWAHMFQSDEQVSGGAKAHEGTPAAMGNHINRYLEKGIGNPKAYARKHLAHFGANPRTLIIPAVAPRFEQRAPAAGSDEARMRRMSTEGLTHLTRGRYARSRLRQLAHAELARRRQKRFKA